MAKYGKWIGGGLGWAFGGPIGALLGFAIGSMVDNSTAVVTTGDAAYSGARRTRAGDFSASLLVLSAAVMKADGKVMQSELDYVKKFFTRQFGQEETKEQLQYLRQLLDKEIPVQEVCHQIRQHMNYSLRLQLLHYLFGISQADGSVSEVEVKTIHQIARDLGIEDKDFESIRAMFYQDTASAYKILEVDPNASDQEVKKAYRRMVNKYHPDKVGHLGEKFQKAAKEKFQKVQDAYEQIKKERKLA